MTAQPITPQPLPVTVIKLGKPCRKIWAGRFFGYGRLTGFGAQPMLPTSSMGNWRNCFNNRVPADSTIAFLLKMGLPSCKLT